MGTTPSLPLSSIVPVSVVISPVGTPGPTFNQALIVGSSTVITAAQRLQQYTSLAGMATAGFSLTSPEYIAATLYFGQSPAPTYLWVGAQILTALQTIAITGGNAGTGYVVGDVITVVHAGGSGGTAKVTTIGGSGAVTGLQILTQGTGYVISAANTTTGGSGTGLEVDITAIGESPLQAITACRNASPDWYICIFVSPEGISAAATTGTASSGSTALTVASGIGLVIGQLVVGTNIAPGTTLASGSGTSWVLSQVTTGALSTTPLTFYTPSGDSDKEAIAGYIEAATPASVYFTTSGEAAILNGTPGNLFATLQASAYNRTLGIYTTTQGGLYPNNPHASDAAAGVAMGRNTGAAGSAFTLALKQLTGIAAEPLSAAQFDAICGPPNRSQTGYNGNAYINFANGSYLCLENGTMFSGRFFDTTLCLDMLVSQIQVNVMNLLTGQPQVPLTQSGIAQIVGVIGQACVALQQIGYIAPSGTWNGPAIGPNVVGTPMPKGYIVYSPNIDTLTTGQRAARQFPPINVLIQLAQAGQSLAVTINVQQ